MASQSDQSIYFNTAVDLRLELDNLMENQVEPNAHTHCTFDFTDANCWTQHYAEIDGLGRIDDFYNHDEMDFYEYLGFTSSPIYYFTLDDYNYYSNDFGDSLE